MDVVAYQILERGGASLGRLWCCKCVNSVGLAWRGFTTFVNA